LCKNITFAWCVIRSGPPNFQIQTIWVDSDPVFCKMTDYDTLLTDEHASLPVEVGREPNTENQTFFSRPWQTSRLFLSINSCPQNLPVPHGVGMNGKITNRKQVPKKPCKD